MDRLADRFRIQLKKAGVKRAELFERSKARRQVRVHDLRATFITIALANGKTETWIADRTGHKSSIMINRYRRAARTVEQLELGVLKPLDLAIPELAEHRIVQPKVQPGSRGGSGGPRARSRNASNRVRSRRKRRAFRFRRRKVWGFESPLVH